MLTIRREQFDAFDRALYERFEARAAQHLRDHFAADCARLGELVLLDDVRHGLRRCVAYGLSTERDLLRYLTLMFVLGRDFDIELPWAAEILQSDASAKTNRLHMQALRRSSRGGLMHADLPGADHP